MAEAASYLLDEQRPKTSFKTPSDMIESATFNFVKNMIVTEATPMIKDALAFTKMNLEVGTLLIGGAGAKWGYAAMSVGSRALVGKAMIGGAQGLAGSMVANGDMYDHMLGASMGAFIGIFTASEFTPMLKNVSDVTVGAISSGLSNAVGQRFTIARNPEAKEFSYTSLAISTWSGSIAGLMAKYGATGITGAVLQNTVQMPADIIGSHISEDYRNVCR